MVNNLTTNPILLDVVGGLSFIAGKGRASNVTFGGNLDVDTTVLIYNAKNQVTRNRFMDTWSNDTAAAPDFWLLSGASAAVAQESTIVHDGTYSAKVTRSGTNAFFSLDLLQYMEPPHDTIAWWVGRNIIAGMWVYATVGSRGYVETYDGQTTTTSSAQASSGNWEWLQTAAVEVHASATELVIRGKVITGDTSVYFDAPLLFEAREWLQLSSTGPAVPIHYPMGNPFDGLYLATLTGGTVHITI